MAAYIVVVEEITIIGTSTHEIAGIFTLDGMMGLIDDCYSCSPMLSDTHTPIFRVFVGRPDIQCWRTLDNPHFTIHYRTSSDPDVCHYTINDDPSSLTEEQLREVIERKYDPENWAY